MKQKKSDEKTETDRPSFIKEAIRQHIQNVNRPTSEINRKRIAVLVTDAMLEVGVFASLSENLNQEMFLAMRYEQALFHALKDTSLICDALPEEENFGAVRLVSEAWTETPEPANILATKTINLIKEVTNNGHRSGIPQLHPGEATPGALGDRQEAAGPLEALRASVRKGL